MAEYNKILKAGLQANYDALQVKDANVLYFCTDTGKMYKGDVDFTNAVIYAATKPAKPVVDKLYVLADTNTVEVYNGTKWTVVSYPMATALSAASDDVHTVSAKAVYDAIEAAKAAVTGGADVVKDVAAGDGAGQVKVTKGDGTSKNVTVTNVVTKPTWDSTGRVLTLPVAGGDSVVVNIGKDIFINPDAANGYNEVTQTIDLYLNDGKGGTGTKIAVPAAGLVDIYTGTTSNGTKASVDGKVIKVDLVLDPSAKNKLTLSAAGLMLDLSDYSTTTEMNTAIKVAKDAADAAQAKADANEKAITTLNGDAATTGSVAAKIKAESDALKGGVIKTAQDTADAAKTQAETNKNDITTLNGAASVAGSVAAKIAAESKVLKEGVIKTAQDTADQAVAAAATAQEKADSNEEAIGTLNGGVEVVGSVDAKIAAESKVLKDGVIATAQSTANKGVTDAATAQKKADANEQAIGTLNGDATTAGSVANKIKAESDTLKNGVIKTAQTTADQGVADAATAQAKADANETEIGKIADAIAWGTF